MVQLAAGQAAHQTFLAYPATSVEAGVATRTAGGPCLVPAIRNERLPKDFKGPRKVPNYTADLQPGAWIESCEMAMELLEVSDGYVLHHDVGWNGSHLVERVATQFHRLMSGVKGPVHSEPQGHM